MHLDLPTSSPEAVPIGNSSFAILTTDDAFTYFCNLVPFDSHAIDDRAAMRLRIGSFAVVGKLSPQDLADAFGVSRATVQRARKRLLDEGAEGVLKPPGGRGPSVFTPQLAEKLSAQLEAGLNCPAVARELGVSVSSVYKWRGKGLIGASKSARSPVGRRSRRPVGPARGGAAGRGR